MDSLLEVLFEVIVEIIFGGLIGTSKSRRVPMPLRILAAALLMFIFVGMGGLIIFTGIVLLRDSSIVAGIIMLVIAAMFWGFLIWKFVKAIPHKDCARIA